MKSRSESEVEKGSNEEEKESRKEAGFEFAAEPNEVILLFPTIYYMAAVSVLIVIVSIAYWASLTSNQWDYFLWSLISTLIIGLIIFLPQYFANIINFAINLCCWMAFCIYMLVNAIRFGSAKKEAKELDQLLKFYGLKDLAILNRMMTAGIACSAINCVLSLIVVILMSRMTLYYYKNR